MLGSIGELRSEVRSRAPLASLGILTSRIAALENGAATEREAITSYLAGGEGSPMEDVELQLQTLRNLENERKEAEASVGANLANELEVAGDYQPHPPVEESLDAAEDPENTCMAVASAKAAALIMIAGGLKKKAVAAKARPPSPPSFKQNEELEISSESSSSTFLGGMPPKSDA